MHALRSPHTILTLALALIRLKRDILDIVEILFGARASHRLTLLLKAVFPEGKGIQDPFSAGDELKNTSVPNLFK